MARYQVRDGKDHLRGSSDKLTANDGYIGPTTKLEKVYRSPDLARGVFGIPASCHLHIDGAKDYGRVLGVVRRLEAIGNPGKVNHVHDFIAGQQREILPETYQSHTPTLEGREDLGFFSTTRIHNRANALAVMELIPPFLIGMPGTIIELEQVYAVLTAEGWNRMEPSANIRPVTAREVILVPSPTMPFEIHHQFDLPKQGPAPLSLPELLSYSEQNNVMVGGWFVFEKDDSWAYRSNAFVRSKGLIELVEREQEILTCYLNPVKPRTLVERVLGIWHLEQ